MERLAGPGISRISLAAVRLSSVDLGRVGTLDEAERRLAAAFGSNDQQDRFLAGRIALRDHAARVAGVSPGALMAYYVCEECNRGDRAHGMPRYQAGPRGSTVRASLSRSGDWCLLAASTDEEVLGVGVDLESGTAADFEGFGSVAMSAREREQLQNLAPSLRARFQTLLWTRKEAVLKALGSGLTVDPRLVDVSGPVPLVPGRESSSDRWLIDVVSPDSVGLPDGVIATVALLLKSRP